MDLTTAARLLSGELSRRRVPHVVGVALHLDQNKIYMNLCVELDCTDVASLGEAIIRIPRRYDRHKVHIKLGN